MCVDGDCFRNIGDNEIYYSRDESSQYLIRMVKNSFNSDASWMEKNEKYLQRCLSKFLKA